ncbi:MerR family transcriptional regulator [Oceanobacillus picturae]|uniref:MerR family transcriptional regulator n=1 Tax=Oceanobacillus picturae TaxID=171693 RepID=UPI000E67ADFE|nr:methyltransferase domain-containing protein [Oceanobacillus picturae]RIU92742.1 methyltransferase domain-containing protein [Oceanobacillus picturae]
MYIKEVAKKLETSTRTIRYYEEKGLITPAKEENNQYRFFNDEDLIRLSTILSLREVGLPVEAIHSLLKDKDMRVEDYLNVQRGVLYEQWLELKDMIQTLDLMTERAGKGDSVTNDLFGLAKQLKTLKAMRKNWQDKWNFDSQAHDYDQSIKMHGYKFNVHQDYETALNKVVDTIQLNSGDLFLDIGIGTGNLGSRFIESGAKVIGVDQSEEMLAVCKEKHPEIETRKGHFLALPVMNMQVDAIVSSYALHHLTDDEKLLALEEMDRVLKRHGEICIADLMFLNEEHRQHIMQSFREEGNVEAIGAIEDEYYADRSQLVDWLEKHDYTVETHQFNSILSMIYARKHVENER